MADINTGGGSSIGGGVGTGGGDFTGRDAPSAQVNVQFGDRNPKEIAEIIRLLQLATYGDDKAGIDGIVATLKALGQKVEAMRQRLETVVMHQTSTEQELNEAKKELTELKEQMTGRRETSRSMQIMLYFITAGLAALIVFSIWPKIF